MERCGEGSCSGGAVDERAGVVSFEKFGRYREGCLHGLIAEEMFLQVFQVLDLRRVRSTEFGRDEIVV